MVFWSLFTFFAFTALVAIITYIMTRRANHSNESGFFLAGRSLTFPFIAGSLLLTNLSTEQMVGLNGSAFSQGFSVFAWEVVAVVALVLMALFFLPKFLKSGITTVPEFLELRYNSHTSIITNILFLAVYMIVLMPMLLYTGARAMIDIFQLDVWAKTSSITFIADIFNSSVGNWLSLQLIIILIAVIGGIYALWGGLKSVAVSDTMNGVGLLTGGLLMAYFAYKFLGDGSFLDGVKALPNSPAMAGRFNSLGASNSEVPAATILTGVLLINVFYWCTNQQIIQRTLGASSLAEGQKGVLLTATFKLLGPLYLVLPGMIAYALYAQGRLSIPLNASGVPNSAAAYGSLVNTVLPDSFRGFFAAALLGAILSSFNSCLNSISTLYSLGIYKKLLHKHASEHQVVKAGQKFGWIFAGITVIIAPFLSNTDSIFNYLQKMNTIYAIPILAVIIVGILSKRTPAIAANVAMVIGIILLTIGQCVPDFDTKVMNSYHFSGIVFLVMVAIMLFYAKFKPLAEPYVQQDVKAVNITPWKHAPAAGAILLLIVVSIYIIFADFAAL